MSEFEGWAPDGLRGGSPPAGSVAYRNHNPGNLRSSPFALGQRDGFAYFLDDDTGLFAMIWDIWMKAHGKTQTGLGPESTVYDLVRVYSAEPPAVVEKYVVHIEAKTGLKRSVKLKELVSR